MITTRRRQPAAFAATLMLASLILLFGGQAWGQRKGQPASNLISELTHYRGEHIRSSCGLLGTETGQNREAARALAALGPEAAPAIEEALDSIEKDGMQSRFALGTFWLSTAFAKIKGPAAFPRLRRMIEDPRLESFHSSLGTSVALSLGLTSYVAGSSTPTSPTNCRAPEPPDSLDRLILAWERNDQRAFEESLGPSARAALMSMLGGGAWEALRTELWHASSANGAAVGYHLETPGRWSEPEETLGQEGARVASRDPEIDTAFKSRSGIDCGKYTIKFLTPTAPRPAQYLIDNPDLLGLLRLVTSCATDTATIPDASPKN